MNFQTINASASPETQMNENFETIDHASVYGKRHPVTTGLTWGYYGGRWGGTAVTAGTLTLTNSADNYIVVNRGDGSISVSTSSTNWNLTSEYARVYKLTVAGSVVTTTEDHRAGPYGIFAQEPRGGLLVKAMGSPEGNITLTAAEGLYETIEITGTLTAVRDLFVPVTTARSWTIYVNTTGFGIRVINAGSPQSGVSIAVGKTAIVRSTGSIVVRVTADNP